MYWPGTTAAARGRAGFDVESALGALATLVMTPVPSARRPDSAGPYAMAPLAPAPLVRGPLAPPCGDDPDLFFAEAPEDVESAKAMCLQCSARAACLAGALERREPWGVWGGELLLRGEIVPRKRPRGRPRKSDTTVAA